MQYENDQHRKYVESQQEHPAVTKAMIIAEAAKALQDVAAERIPDLQQNMTGIPPWAQADVAWHLKQASEACDHVRKKCNATNETSFLVMVHGWIKRHATSKSRPPIRGRWGTASPKISETIIIPNRHESPDKWQALMTALGVKEDFAALDLIRIPWNKLREYATEMESQGKSVDPAFKDFDRVPHYSCRMTAGPRTREINKNKDSGT